MSVVVKSVIWKLQMGFPLLPKTSSWRTHKRTASLQFFLQPCIYNTILRGFVSWVSPVLQPLLHLDLDVIGAGVVKTERGFDAIRNITGLLLIHWLTGVDSRVGPFSHGDTDRLGGRKIIFLEREEKKSWWDIIAGVATRTSPLPPVRTPPSATIISYLTAHFTGPCHLKTFCPCNG